MEWMFTWVAKMYGYYTLANLLKNNFILVCVISAFILLCLVFYVTLNRQFPKPGRDPFKRWAMQFVLLSTYSAFIFVVFFSIFYEAKKVTQEGYYQPAYYQSSVIV